MGARFRSWWQQIKKHRVAIGVVAMVLVVAITLIIAGYWFDWTGFNGYNKITVAHTISGTNTGTVIRSEEYQPGKTLWDWMQLLFIPVVLAIAGFWFNHRERKAAELRAENERKAAELRAQAEQEIEQQRANAEQEIASDNQREAALQAYVNEMSELLLHENLRKSKPENEVRKIARVRTLTVLARLDGKRKRNLLLFLYDAGLIDRGHQIIDVSDADLSEADLSEVTLYRYRTIKDSSPVGGRITITAANADLSGVNLRNATLNGANLNGVKLGAEDRFDLAMSDIDYSTGSTIIANLSEAKLVKANLGRAALGGVDLRRADLSEAILGGAYLQHANLSLANLYGADLSIETLIANDYDPEDPPDISGWIGADLSEANLSGANLSEANLWQANLSGADLREANLSRAYLKDAVGITPEKLEEQAKSLKGATMPDGSIHP
jgi:uncharacterized protein YjbI with pentapeptide repeats